MISAATKYDHNIAELGKGFCPFYLLLMDKNFIPGMCPACGAPLKIEDLLETRLPGAKPRPQAVA